MAILEQNNTAGTPGSVDNETILPGMLVYSADGQKIGKIDRMTASHIFIKEGLIFTEKKSVSTDDVKVIRDGNLILKYTVAELENIFKFEKNAPKTMDETDPRSLEPDDYRSGQNVKAKAVHDHSLTDMYRLTNEVASTDLNSDGSGAIRSREQPLQQ